MSYQTKWSPEAIPPKKIFRREAQSLVRLERNYYVLYSNLFYVRAGRVVTGHTSVNPTGEGGGRRHSGGVV